MLIFFMLKEVIIEFTFGMWAVLMPWIIIIDWWNGSFFIIYKKWEIELIIKKTQTLY